MWVLGDISFRKIMPCDKKVVSRKEKDEAKYLNVNTAEYGTFNASERVSAPSNTFMRSSTLENSPVSD